MESSKRSLPRDFTGMKSSFLQGVVGFIIVMSVLVGGMVLAGLCHELLTPSLAICYVIWLWVCLIPFFWLCYMTLHHVEHPVRAYVGLLPFVLLMGLLTDIIGPENPWMIPAMLVAIASYQVFLSGVRKVWPMRRLLDNANNSRKEGAGGG
jgi:hypothetical protein